ncbi:hypothetical protein TRAPUB_7171 [Trametes pubescens]|uniref:HAT C-terminal dimerisation domain-containing protein n=1 Tax=Trametes pubescens TaxID=154538 RepID=A0A1M2V3W1_TRAPU|nr:hypothetical protein TRAPUB_7171 [Trametes pubescens]
MQPSTPALFVSILGRNKAVLDELEAYLEAPPLSTVEDPLAYWDIVLKTSPSSLLTTMAIDFLTTQEEKQQCFKEKYKGMMPEEIRHLHICMDSWTSPNGMSFLGITVHWHWDGEIRHIILDFIRSPVHA